jgi:aspartate/methionine/tyrosine aminotransferase
MWTNYPGMPTGAPATKDLFERLVDFGRRHKILIVNDNPYSFIMSDKPLSIFTVPKAFTCALELNSLSKSHNMSGWRIGVATGGADYISELLKVKSQMDSGMFRPLQIAAAAALSQGPEWFAALNEEYRRRRAAASKIFDVLGASYNPDSQGLFLWGKVGGDSVQKSDFFLHEAGVFMTPGIIFGKNGEGHLRISLCRNVPLYERAVEKIKAVL